MEVFRPLGSGELRHLVRTLGRAGRIVAASRFTAQRVSEICPGAAVVAGFNGVDLELFAPTGGIREKDHPIQMLSVGRLVQRKRFDLAIEALGLVRERGSDAGLWIVGEGPLEGELREQAAGLGLGDRVKFMGGMGDSGLAVLYRSADLFISPCQSDLTSGDVEGFGLTFAEAAACGLPSVGLAEGGVTDAVEEGVSGILTSKEEFTETVAQLISDPERMEKLRGTARESAERRLDICRVVPNLLPQQ
jgi:phosphatidylinositol alpha-1,6-mannosyltransferase